MIVLEIAVETQAAAQAAADGGADRIELAPDLNVGGLTPSDELTTSVLSAIDIPVVAMVRPRPGDFVYSEHEIAQMCRSMEGLRALGVHGVVAGALTSSQQIDVDAMTALVSAAGSVPVIFHRAFDAVADQAGALEQLVALGVQRVLTSGGAATALEGAERLRSLERQAAGRIVILAGGGVRASNVNDVVTRSGVSEIHTRLVASGEHLTTDSVLEFRRLIS